MEPSKPRSREMAVKTSLEPPLCGEGKTEEESRKVKPWRKGWLARLH